jgi:hypothetical protein
MNSLAEAYGKVLLKEGLGNIIATGAKAMHGGIAPKPAPPQQQNSENQESQSHQRKMLKISNQLEPMANALFDIGSRINSGSILPDDGELLIEYSTALEIMAGIITKEYQ